MPVPHAQHKFPAPSLLPSNVPNEDAPHPCGNTPPLPPVIAVPPSQDTSPCHPANPSIGGNAADALGLQWSDLDSMVLQGGIPDIAPRSLPIFVNQHCSKGVVPLETITYRALLDPGMLDSIQAHSDYPKWDLYVCLYALVMEGEHHKVAEHDPTLLFQ